MSRKKKKISSEALQKIERARQRNEFIARLHKFCDQVAGPDVFSLIPEKELEMIYLMRCQPIRVREAKGQAIDPEMMKEFKTMAPLMFKSWQLPFEIGSLKTISAYDFFTVGFTLIIYANRIKEGGYDNAFIVKNKLAHIATLEHNPSFSHLWNQHAQMANLFTMLYSDLGYGCYVFKTEMRIEVNGILGLNIYLEAYCIKPEDMPVTIENRQRQVFRVGWPLAHPAPHFEYVRMPSAALDKLPGLFLDVYIQSHALKRFFERMNGVPSGLLHYSLFHSLKNPKVFRNKDGTLLFEFSLCGKKSGYLVASVVEGMIIIRTFLFLTNAGTPEGDRLRGNLGLKTKDVIYLQIDKLSAFLESDIAENPEVKEIFLAAGCRTLFEIDKAFYYPQSEKERHLAGFIAAYLGLKGAA
ncbi:MAG: hypothetical protein K0S33_1395 [Bacteroidetes bacterium]|jgi:hypothetical protein|nr:hypothetical protein [Bacteroidota bacterium]